MLCSDGQHSRQKSALRAVLSVFERKKKTEVEMVREWSFMKTRPHREVIFSLVLALEGCQSLKGMLLLKKGYVLWGHCTC